MLVDSTFMFCNNLQIATTHGSGKTFVMKRVRLEDYLKNVLIFQQPMQVVWQFPDNVLLKEAIIGHVFDLRTTRLTVPQLSSMLAMLISSTKTTKFTQVFD